MSDDLIINKESSVVTITFNRPERRNALSHDMLNSFYHELIKIENDLKASADIFTIDPIKYKISEKIKKSFDPKRIFNPGKMYTGI